MRPIPGVIYLLNQAVPASPGLLFVATLFGTAASPKAILVLQAESVSLPNQTRAFGRGLAASLLGQFGTRMAAVFIASVATVGSRTHALPRWLASSAT